MINAGTVFVDVLPRMIGFAAGMQKGMGGVAGQVNRVGGTLTKGLTVPIVAAAAAATKLALDYDTAFTRIAAVSNTSAAQVKQWRGEVLQLSGRTARSPRELAGALYFLASAGLKSNQVMPTLGMSAKAAAVGLGDTADIARLTAQVLNAYPPSVINAAKALDILTAAVKAGTAEPAEFANAMGRILGPAQKAGVEFEELAASLAGLSNIGLDVNEGVTAMRGLLLAMTAPGTQAAKTMRSVGISANEMRKTLAEGGLLSAMQLLEKATGGNIDKMRKIIPNVRSLTGQFGLTGANASKVADVFRQVANSTGELDRAFEKTRRSPMFKMQQAWADLERAGIEAGANILPHITKLTQFVGELARGFSRLPPETQEFIIKALGITAIVGPVLLLTGKILALGKAIKSLAIVQGILKGLGVASAQGAKGLVPLLAGYGKAAVVIAAVGTAVQGARTAWSVFNRDSNQVLNEWSRTAGLTRAEMDRLGGAQRINFHDQLPLIKQWTRGIASAIPFVGNLHDKMNEAALSTFGEVLQQARFANVENAFQRLNAVMVQAFDNSNGSMQKFREELLRLSGIGSQIKVFEQLRRQVGNIGVVFGQGVANILKGTGAIQGFISVIQFLPTMNRKTATSFATVLQQLAHFGVNLSTIVRDTPQLGRKLFDALAGGDAKRALRILEQIRQSTERLANLRAIEGLFTRSKNAAEGFRRVMVNLPNATMAQSRSIAVAIQGLARYGVNLKNLQAAAPRFQKAFSQALRVGDAKGALAILERVRSMFTRLSRARQDLASAQQLGLDDTQARAKIERILQQLGILEKPRKINIDVPASQVRDTLFSQFKQPPKVKPQVDPGGALKNIGLITDAMKRIGAKPAVAKVSQVGAQPAARNVNTLHQALQKTSRTWKPAKVSQLGAQAAQRNVDSLIRSLNSIPRTKSTTITVTTVRVPHGGGYIGKLHEGGLASLGRLASDEYVAVGQTGEYWFSRPAVRNLGVPFLEGLHSAAREGLSALNLPSIDLQRQASISPITPAPIAPARPAPVVPAGVAATSVVGASGPLEIEGRITIDNWETGEARFRGIVNDAFRRKRRRDEQIAHMHRGFGSDVPESTKWRRDR